MKILIQPIFLAIYISYFLTSFLPASAKENGWILTQHSKIIGDQYLYISPHGVKCINPKQGIGWISQTPNWNITFFNDKTKLYYPLSSASWKTKITKNGLVPANVSWSKISTGSIAGLKATEYQMVNSSSSANTNKWQSAAYWTANEINVPPSLAQLINSACGLPTSDAVPLQLSYRSQKGTTETLLSTYHQQNSNIPDSYFAAPTGYKMARNEVEVLVSQENRALINEFANDLGGDNPKSKLSPQLIDASKQITPENINKLPDQVSLPGGRTVSKDQISRFLNKLK